MSKKVYVVGGSHMVIRMFCDAGWIPSGIEEADLICFTGGADVSPFLYGEENVASGNDSRRDFYESGIYHFALQNGVRMVGICRGGQFLNVMNGGKLWQDVDGHATGNDHPLFDCNGDLLIAEASSTHHQMMRPSGNGKVLAYGGRLAKRFVNADGVFNRAAHASDDVEVVYYGATSSLCFQPHPEFFAKRHECPSLFFNMIEKYLF